MFRCFPNTQHTTHTFVLGPWPWPRGLFTLSARLVDGAGAGRCRMPRDRVRSGLGRSTGWARLGSPVDGGGRVRNPRRPSSRGSRVRFQLNPTRITRLPSLLPRLDALDGRQGPGRRPGAECPLRSFNGSSSHGPPPHDGLNGLGRCWDAALAALDAEMDAGDADDTAVDNGTVRVRKPPAMQRRKPTPLQTARWNAVQKAKRRGLSIREVARELGIHRATAKKYMEAVSPPIKRDRVG